MEMPSRTPNHRHLPRESAPFRAGESVVYRDTTGIVVADVATGDHVPTFNPHVWSALGAGVIVRWSDGTITHVREPLDVLRRPH